MARPVARRLAAALLWLVTAALLASCTWVDPAQRSVCLSIVPVIERAGATITINAVAAPSAGTSVIILYSVDRLTPRGLLAPPASRRLTCTFAPDTREGAPRLTGIETSDGRYSGSQMLILRRFWLSDGAAINEAIAPLRFAPGATSSGLFDLPPDWAYALQQAINTIAPASLYALIALGHSLVYGLTSRINLAFGELAMLGAYGAFVALGAATISGAGTAPGIIAALVVSAVLASAWAVALGRTVLGPLAQASGRIFLVATLGASLALREFVARIQGVKEQWSPPILSETLVVADGDFTVVVTVMQIAVGVVAALVCAATILHVDRSRFGRAWRAASDDPLMAAMLGIDPHRLLLRTLALAGIVAGTGGAILTLHYGSIGAHSGVMIGLKGLIAALIGRMGSLRGAVLGGWAIGIIEAAWSSVFGMEWRDVAVLAVLAAFVVLKPAEQVDGVNAPSARRLS